MLRVASFIPVFLFAALHPGAVAGADLPAAIPDTLPASPRLQASNQHLVAVVDSAGDVRGRLFRFERVDGTWARIGEPIPIVVGRNGIGPKREGDGRAPRGIFPLGPAFGYAPTPPDGLNIPYRPMAPGTVCVDDPASSDYNRIVAAGDQAGEWQSAEPMRRDLSHGDDLYQLGVVVEYNRQRAPGAGSCIFLHVWRNGESPTAGCTAMPEDRLRELLAWLRRDAEPLLFQGTRADLDAFRRRGHLPHSIPDQGGDP